VVVIKIIMAVTNSCKTCKKYFTATRNSTGKFCSKNCYWNSKKRVSDYKCIDCNQQISPTKKISRCKPCSGLVRRGTKHHYWKGALVSYRALHHWVVRELGQPTKCEACDKSATGHNMHWANISGEYKREVSDWVRLCAKCHKDFDSQKLLGFKTTGL